MAIPGFIPFPRLATPRLILRQLEDRDAPEIFQLRSNESVNQYINRPKAETINDAQQFIHNINTKINNNEPVLYWAIVPKNDAKLAGTICLFNFDEKEMQAEIGYELLPDHQGMGIMQEAFASVINYCFDQMQLKRIEAFTHVQNSSSIKLLEKNEFSNTGREEKSAGGQAEFVVWARQRQPVTG
jgi:[ribosomal protein S5]-alanine N-acetyltransferase